MEVNVLKIYSGDDEPMRVEFRAPDDTPIDLLTADIQYIQFSVKDKSGRELIYKSFLGGKILYTTDGTDGLVDIYLLQDDTFSLEGDFEYDIQLKKDDRISTAVKSFFSIIKDVNERTT